MKKLQLIFFVFILVGLFVGCEGADTVEIADGQVVQSVAIEKPTAKGSVNTLLLAEYTDKTTMEKFTRAVKTANKIQGILKTSPPNYEMIFTLKDEKVTFHLWLSEKSELGMIMNLKDTNTGYTLTKASTAALITMMNKNAHFRTLAWAAVEESQRTHVRGNWQEATVSRIIYKDQWLIPDNKNLKKLKNKELMTVTFSTDQDGLLGPIVVVINPLNDDVVGFYPRY